MPKAVSAEQLTAPSFTIMVDDVVLQVIRVPPHVGMVSKTARLQYDSTKLLPAFLVAAKGAQQLANQSKSLQKCTHTKKFIEQHTQHRVQNAGRQAGTHAGS